MPAAPRFAPDAAAPWAQDFNSVLTSFEVDPAVGLTAAEVIRRRLRYGANVLRDARRHHVLSILFDQFKSVVILLLLAAGALAMLLSDVVEGLAIFAVIAINAAIGFATEWRAIRSMEALRQFALVDAVVVRNRITSRVSAADLVCGDIVLLDAGDLVPADLRIVDCAKLSADESTLTGESMPVRKRTEALADEVPLLDRTNMAFKGTTVSRGSACGVVVATGANTEFGKIFEQISEAEPQQTPLEKRLDALGSRLAWAVLIMAVLLAVGSVLAGRELMLSVEVAIALSVAAIPEGLPIVATIALARGMWRMARRNALITRLSAVETLGATSVILTDKTGTLTENRMAATEIRVSAEGANAAISTELYRAAALCSNATLQRTTDGSSQGVGDPTEVALLELAAKNGVWRDQLLEQMPEIREDPFDPDSKRMATVHEHQQRYFVAIKGAPEAIIPQCSAVRTEDGQQTLAEADAGEWLGLAESLGADGLRTLAIAYKETTDANADPYEDITLIGLVGLEDPARQGVSEAIQHCHDAGVSVVMVTGDHAATACNIAAEVGIVKTDTCVAISGGELRHMIEAADHDAVLDARVFSRVTPEQKLALIDLYQKAGHVVAMTGDGVNDAPALKKADIGVAMGLRGTAVAKEAAAMVLQDDEFRTIIAAVAHGRAIFENIRKFVVYLLSCNISEILVVTIATIAGAPLPLLPLQILFLNLVTDVFPALALGVGKGSGELMNRKPRPANERVLTRSHWIRIALHGAVISITVLAAMAIAVINLGFESQAAVSVSFCTLAFAQMWHVFNMRSDIRRWLNNEITGNAWVWAALLVCTLLVVAAVYVPFLGQILQLTDPGASGWLLIGVASIVPLLLAPFVRWLSIRAEETRVLSIGSL